MTHAKKNDDLTDVDHGDDCPAPLLLDIAAGAGAFAHDGYAARAAALVGER